MLALAASFRPREHRPAAEEPDRQAVFGATSDNPEKHFLGWLGEVDPDELFASGAAWGISVVRRRVGAAAGSGG